MILATPAAPSVCPMFVFKEPTIHGLFASLPSDMISEIASASKGSPTEVPVPCISTYWISLASTFALFNAALITFF